MGAQYPPVGDGTARVSFGVMRVVATRRGSGRKYRCPCGWEGWSAWGHARRHAETCPRASEAPPA